MTIIDCSIRVFQLKLCEINELYHHICVIPQICINSLVDTLNYDELRAIVNPIAGIKQL